MPMTKRSVTLDADLVEEALEFVGPRGLSALLNEGLRREVLLERGRRLLAEDEAEYGPIPEEDRAAVAEQWPG